MIEQWLQTTWFSTIPATTIATGGLNFKQAIISLMFIMMALRYLKSWWKHRQITEEEENQKIEATYERDENGFYPWEVDTDDSPNRVTPESKPMVNSWGPKRGQW